MPFFVYAITCSFVVSVCMCLLALAEAPALEAVDKRIQERVLLNTTAVCDGYNDTKGKCCELLMEKEISYFFCCC